MSDEPRTLEQLLADWRGDAQALRRRGHDREADQMERSAEAVSRAAEDYLGWLSEDDALLRSGRSHGWLRSQFPDWEPCARATRGWKKPSPPWIDFWARSATETVTQPSRAHPSCGTSKRNHQASLNLQNWGGRTRTSNFPVNSRAVCQLTYTPMLDAQTHRRTDAQRRTGASD